MTGVLMGTAMALYVGRHGSEFAVSLVLTAYFLGMMVFAPVWGAVADVTGRRRAVMVVTGAIATLAILPLALVGELGPTISVGGFSVGGVWLPIGFRFLYAIFAVGFIPVMLTIVSARGGPDGRGRSLGFFNSARAVGFTSGQLAVGVLLGLLIPEILYVVVAAVSLVSTVVAVFVYDPTPSPETQPTFAELRSEVRHRLLPGVDDRSHLRTNGLQWLYVALALRNMTVMGVMSLMPIYLTGSIGLTEAVMGALLALNPITQSVFMLVFGRIADRAGRKPLIAAGMAGSGVYALIAAAAMLPGSLTLRAGVAVVAFVTIGASFSAMTTGAIAFIGDVAPPERESELMGLRSTAKGVGGVVGPPILGAIATFGDIQTAFAFGSVLAFAAAAVAAAALVESKPETARAGAVAGDD